MAVTLDIKTRVDVQQAEQATDKLNEGLNEAQGNTEELGGALDSVTGGAVSGFARLKKGIMGGVAAMKTLRGALIATGLGALVVVLGSIVSYFTSTEEGAQKLRVIMATLGGVVDKVKDVFIDLGGAIVSAFEDPQKAIDDLGKQFTYYFTQFIPNAIQKVIDGLGLLGESISLLFEGEFSKAADTAAEGFGKVLEGATDLNPVTALMKEIAEGVAEIAVEAANAGEAAGQLEKRLNALKMAERDIALERAKANAAIEQQKLIAEDTTKSIEERIKATQKASDIETGLLAKEIKLAQERVDIIAAQNALSASSEEDIQKLYDAQIALAQLQQQSGPKQIELQNKLNSLRKEEAELLKSESMLAADNAIKEAELREAELEELLTFYEKKRLLELEQEGLTAEQKRAINLAYQETALNLKKEFAAKEKALQDQKDAEQAKTDADNLRKAQELEAAKLSIIGNAFAVAQGLAEDNEKAQRKIAAAEALFNTYLSINKTLAAFSGVPIPGYAIIQALATGAFGLLQVKKILKGGSNSSSGSISGGGGGGGRVPEPRQSDVPDFSFANRGVGNAQNANFRPMRAYVVNQEIDDKKALAQKIDDQMK